MKMSQYVNIYMLSNPNSAFGSKLNRDYAHLPNDQFKLRKALYYLGFAQLNPGDEVRMEFANGLKEGISDWWNDRKCDGDKLGTKNVICDTLLCPTHKGKGTKEDPIDLTEDSDKEDNDLDDVDSDEGSDKEVEEYCCNGEEGEYEDLNKEIEKVDNNVMSEKDVLETFGVRPSNPTPESDENKKDK